MIGIVIPAHNEEAWLARCLASILEAARDPALDGEAVRTAGGDAARQGLICLGYPGHLFTHQCH